MGNGWLIVLGAWGSLASCGLAACSGKSLHVGDDGAGNGQAGTGSGQAGAPAGAGGTSAGAGGITSPSGTGGTTDAGGAAGSAGATGTGGAAGQGGGGAGAVGINLSLNPSAAAFAGTLVEAVSAPQSFTVRNDGIAPVAVTGALALEGTNAADFLITSNACGTTLQPGASCQLAVAFAPKTRSGSRSASLSVSAPTGLAAAVSLSGTALPSLGLLAGGLGGSGNVGTTPVPPFGSPSGVAGDGAGHLYVSDSGKNVISKVVLATGAVTTLAGGSSQGAGVDGIGAAASFSQPGGITSDGAGNLYVADSYNNTIRKVVIATGAVTTLAGKAGQSGGADGTGAAARFALPTGIVSDGAGNLYVCELSNRTVRKIVIATGAVTTLAGTAGATGGGDGTGADARFAWPGGIATDGAGNLYVSDAGDNGTIRKVVIATGVVTTFAGTVGQYASVDGTGAAARFSAPFGIVSDGAGSLYVGDGGTIRKIVIATGAVTTVAGTAGQGGYADGTGANARLGTAFGIASDGVGNLYLADTSNDAIRKVVVAGWAVTTVAGAPALTSADGTGANARFTHPSGIAVDQPGNVYVTDGNGTVRKVVVATRAVTTLAGAQGQRAFVDGAGLAARFFSPYGIAGDSAGSLYVVDGFAIRKVSLATGAVTTIAGAATTAFGASPFTGPSGVVSDLAGNLYVNDAVAIRKVASTTGAITTLVALGRSPEDMLSIGIASDGMGHLYFANWGTLEKVDIASGAITALAGGGGNGSADGIGAAAQFSFLTGIASDGAGNVYVADGSTIRKIVVDTATVSTVIGSADRRGVSLGALPASLNTPQGIVVLPTGELAIVDSTENVVLIGHL